MWLASPWRQWWAKAKPATHPRSSPRLSADGPQPSSVVEPDAAVLSMIMLMPETRALWGQHLRDERLGRKGRPAEAALRFRPEAAWRWCRRPLPTPATCGRRLARGGRMGLWRGRVERPAGANAELPLRFSQSATLVSTAQQAQHDLFVHTRTAASCRVYRLSRTLSGLGGTKKIHLLGPSTFFTITFS